MICRGDGKTTRARDHDDDDFSQRMYMYVCACEGGNDGGVFMGMRVFVDVADQSIIREPDESLI